MRSRSNQQAGAEYRSAGIASGLHALPVLLLTSVASVTLAAEGPCSAAAQAMRAACTRDIQDNYFTALAKCVNLTDSDQRARCQQVANALLASAPDDCNAELEARDDFCDELGQAAYDPVIDPAHFVDPTQIGGSVAPNAYFPLVPGSFWVYKGGGEINTVRVTSETREIEGITCAIVHDVVETDGEVTEDTQDFFAQDVAGNVWYFGEVSQELEDGFIEDIDGSWLTGRELAKPGIAFEAAPRVGDAYRQEFALGEAEDGGRVLSITASESVPAASCDGTCVLTEDFNSLEPDSVEHKYYAPGIGNILELDPQDNGRNELISYHIGAP
jgi:hypothetical protein